MIPPLRVVTSETSTEYLAEEPHPLQVVTVTRGTDPEIRMPLSVVTSKKDTGIPLTSLSSTAAENKFYQVLNPEQDEIVTVSHQDIISRHCTVDLENLDANSILDIQTYLRGEEKHTVGKATDQSSEDLQVVAKRKRHSYRPGHKPSKDRLKAQ